MIKEQRGKKEERAAPPVICAQFIRKHISTRRLEIISTNCE